MDPMRIVLLKLI